ncbi:MAG: DUF2079 domain-containing protein [Mycobacteriales bacterium]
MGLVRDVATAPEPRHARAVTHAAGAVIALALLLQLGVLVRRSWAQYHSGNVAVDFAIFHQAWHQIGQGDLSPVSTLLRYPYWQSHFELIMWPLSLVGLLFPSGATLLVLQDLAIVGSELLALLWVLEVTQRDRTWRPWHLLPVLTALLLLVTSDRIQLAARGDFHFQPFATLLLLGGARALWRGEIRRAWYWLLPALLTGDVAGTYLAGLGLSAAVARRDTRATGLALVAVGAGWTVSVGLLGASRGSAIGGYQPLVDERLPSSGGALLVVLVALLLHPARPLSVLWSKLDLFATNLVGTGLVGLLHPWTFGVTAVVLLANGLQESTAFLAPFQNFPALLFGTVGTALSLDWLGRRAAAQRADAAGPVVPAALVMAAAVAVVGLLAVLARPATEPGYPEPAGAAAALDLVARAAGPQDQVIASFGIVGRFAGREHVRSYLYPRSTPVEAPRVVFVFSSTIGNVPAPAEQEAAAAAVRALGATPLVDTADVKAFLWVPPAGTSQVTLP